MLLELQAAQFRAKQKVKGKPGARDACVLCPFELPPASGWDLYTMDGTVALYVSVDPRRPNCCDTEHQQCHVGRGRGRRVPSI